MMSPENARASCNDYDDAPCFFLDSVCAVPRKYLRSVCTSVSNEGHTSNCVGFIPNTKNEFFKRIRRCSYCDGE